MEIPNLLEELDRIRHKQIKEITEGVLAQVPQHFWEKPSSSTGKYHPEDERGPGGLVLHTKRGCKVAEIIMDSWILPTSSTEDNIIRAACILHDTYRYGPFEIPSTTSLKDHPELASMKICELFPQSRIAQRIAGCVLTHMGRWGEVKPKTDPQWTVHLADTIAAKYTL